MGQILSQMGGQYGGGQRGGGQYGGGYGGGRMSGAMRQGGYADFGDPKMAGGRPDPTQGGGRYMGGYNSAYSASDPMGLGGAGVAGGGSGQGGSPFTSTLKNQEQSAWDGQYHAPVGPTGGTYADSGSSGGSGSGGVGGFVSALKDGGTGGGSVSKFSGDPAGSDGSYGGGTELTPDPEPGMTVTKDPENPMRRRRGGYYDSSF